MLIKERRICCLQCDNKKRNNNIFSVELNNNEYKNKKR